MLVVGICVGSEQKLERYALEGIRQHLRGSHVLLRRGQTSIFEAYNSMLEEYGTIKDAEGLLLIHEDTEMRDPNAATKLKTALADPAVGVVGLIGGKGVRSVRWAAAAQQHGKVPDAHYGQNDYGEGDFDVDQVDGLFLALSNPATEQLRFDDQRYSGFHAYDADISLQAKAAGFAVRTMALDVFHHTKGGFGNVKQHRSNDLAFRRKWGVPLPSLPQRMVASLRNAPYPAR